MSTQKKKVKYCSNMILPWQRLNLKNIYLGYIPNTHDLQETFLKKKIVYIMYMHIVYIHPILKPILTQKSYLVESKLKQNRFYVDYMDEPDVVHRVYMR